MSEETHQAPQLEKAMNLFFYFEEIFSLLQLSILKDQFKKNNGKTGDIVTKYQWWCEDFWNPWQAGQKYVLRKVFFQDMASQFTSVRMCFLLSVGMSRWMTFTSTVGNHTPVPHPHIHNHKITWESRRFYRSLQGLPHAGSLIIAATDTHVKAGVGAF